MRTFLISAVLLIAATRAAADPVDKLVDKIRERADAAAVRESPIERPLRDLVTAAEHVEASMARADRHMEWAAGFLRDIGPCPSDTTDTPLPETPAALRDEIGRLPEETDRAFDELASATATLRDSLRSGPHKPREALAEGQRALEAADQLLTQRRDASYAANWLRRVAAERRRNAGDASPCKFLEALFPLPEPVTLSEMRRDPLAPIRRLHETNRRAIERRVDAVERGDWGFGIGFLFTGATNPEYGTIADPINTGRLAIAETGEQSLIGLPVLNVAFRPPADVLPNWRFRPYVELGASLDTERSAFTLGGALDVGPYMRVGIGWLAHQQKVLASGQTAIHFDDRGVASGAVTNVPNADAILTENDFASDVYVSVSLALEKLLRR